MKKIALLVILFNSFNFCYCQEISIQRIRNIISSSFPKIENHFLESIITSSVRFQKVTSKGDTIVLLEIDTLKMQDGRMLTDRDIRPMNFILLINGNNEKIILDIDCDKSYHFENIGEIKNSKHSYLIFYNFSSVIGALKYYFLNMNDGLLYETEFFEDNYRIDYLSIDMESAIYRYYYGDTEDAKIGKLVLCPKN